MPFNISKFQSQIADSSYLYPSKYNVYVTPPASMKIDTNPGKNSAPEKLVYRVEDFIAPSVSLILRDVARYGIGIAQKEPASAKYNEITLTFISDGYGEIWSFWQQWLQLVFGFSAIDNKSLSQIGTYTLNYKDDYSSVVQLNIFDSFGKDQIQFYYNQAYPIQISDVKFNWGETNIVMNIKKRLKKRILEKEGINIIKIIRKEVFYPKLVLLH